MRVHDLWHFAGSEHRIDFRNLRAQLVAIALGQAAGDDQSLAGAGLLVLGHLEDRVDRLLLGFVDERAGVDDEHVGVGGIAGELMPLFLGEPEHHLGVDEVLGAAERDHSNFHACNVFSPGSSVFWSLAQSGFAWTEDCGLETEDHNLPRIQGIAVSADNPFTEMPHADYRRCLVGC